MFNLGDVFKFEKLFKCLRCDKNEVGIRRRKGERTCMSRWMSTNSNLFLSLKFQCGATKPSWEAIDLIINSEFQIENNVLKLIFKFIKFSKSSY